MEKEPKKKMELEDLFPFYKHDIQDIYLNAKIPNSLLKDLQKWSKEQQFRRFLTNQLYDWAFKQKQERLLVQSAKVSVKVIGTMFKVGVPWVVVDVYLSLLLKNKDRVKKYLNHQQAQRQFTYVPPILIIGYISLYKIHLTEKEKHSLIEELVEKNDTCNEHLSKLPQIFGEKAYYTEFLIKEIQRVKKYNVAGKIMKRLRIPKEKYPFIQVHLLQIAAIYMYKKDESFTWENLEEVFEEFPQALAAGIRANILERNAKKSTKEGFAAICKRNPQILSKIPNKMKQIINKIDIQLPNKLRNNKFQPSDPKFFSLGDFDIKQKDVIWVSKQNLRECLQMLSQQKLIGIDTESRVARTCLDTARQLLATIQIATRKCVYIFDAYMLKQTKIILPQIEIFFRNKEVTIIGHTLSADLNGDVTELLGFKGEVACKAIDICPIFKYLNPDEKKAGLAYISEKVLGKQICKQYTLTNWNRRPLLRNQIHYAALDAVIVIKIWEKLRQDKKYQQAELVCMKRDKREQSKNERGNQRGEKEIKEDLDDQKQQMKGQYEEEQTIGEEYLNKE